MDISTLKSLVSYDPESGRLFWKKRDAEKFAVRKSSLSRVSKTWNRLNAGREIKSHDTYGYVSVHIMLGGKRYRISGHRAAWAIHYGAWPEGVIDHINGFATDNRICNLRECSISENNRNQKLSARNTSGKIGVTYYKRTEKWRAWIKVNGKTISLGYHFSLDDAIAARVLAENTYGFFEAERNA